MGAPIFVAIRGVEGENVVLGRSDQRVVHHDRSGLETSVLMRVVDTQNFQLGNIRRIDLAER